MYQIAPNDSFYTNWNAHYFRHQDSIIGITGHEEVFMNTYHIKNKQFTPTHKLTYVDYRDLKQVDYLYDDFDCAIVIDVQNQQWAKTSNFPYWISEIDGNYITSCKKDNHYYLFHSHTERYETGVFIFDIKTNTYNHDDFTVDTDMITNRFINLHEKDIISCDASDKIIINNDGYIYEYNPITDECIESLILSNFPVLYNNSEIKVSDFLFEKQNSQIHIYDFKALIKSIKICEEDEFVIFWDITDYQLIILCQNYRNLLYTSREEYFKARQAKIIFVDIWGGTPTWPHSPLSE